MCPLMGPDGGGSSPQAVALPKPGAGLPAGMWVCALLVYPHQSGQLIYMGDMLKDKEDGDVFRIDKKSIVTRTREPTGTLNNG